MHTSTYSSSCNGDIATVFFSYIVQIGACFIQIYTVKKLNWFLISIGYFTGIGDSRSFCAYSNLLRIRFCYLCNSFLSKSWDNVIQILLSCVLWCGACIRNLLSLLMLLQVHISKLHICQVWCNFLRFYLTKNGLRISSALVQFKVHLSQTGIWIFIQLKMMIAWCFSFKLNRNCIAVRQEIIIIFLPI